MNLDIDRRMKSPDDIWTEPGELPEDVMQELIELSAPYGDSLKKNSEDQDALIFFRNPDNAICLLSQCNLNRR